MGTFEKLDRSSGNAVHSTADLVMSSDPLECDHSLYLLQDWESGSQSLASDSRNAFLPNSFTEPEFAGTESAGLKDTDNLQDNLTSAERRAQSNRAAQRRARARRKAHFENAEAKLAWTSAALQELQNKQKALEARNNLLEKMVQLGQTQPDSTALRSAVVSRPSHSC